MSHANTAVKGDGFVIFTIITPLTCKLAADEKDIRYPKYILTRNDPIQNRNGIIHQNLPEFMREGTMF